MQVLGIDIGGSWIKAALVDVNEGTLLGVPFELPTPRPATPGAIADQVGQLVSALDWQGRVGIGFPAVMREGVVGTAANIDASWIGIDAVDLFGNAIPGECVVLNDADAAGLAEMRFGAGAGHDETVLVLTLGTGIGSALFCRQQLFPNLELGSFPLKSGIAEEYAAASIRIQEHLSWQEWGGRLNQFFAAVERLLSPDLIIIGGGVSQRSDQFFPYLQTRARLLPASLLNQAGIVGAACHAGILDP
ncbi:polyphosphate--glucose phosphotransferase [Pelovirga terrestris]|uniref:ROK family protein n=1 Tax=Pelovirga terrestris TaxID=2771352 RepID=A0A8J6QWJ0_9BACT|nr:ROK family protein [Pelovirga terrestris]MBD1399753.1 ROK family protein [Pelovirga terrestris]